MSVDTLKIEPGESMDLYFAGGLIHFRVKKDGTAQAFIAGKVEIKDYIKDSREYLDG
jgi:hypothetical protein